MQEKLMQLEMVVKQTLTKEAAERFGNIKAASPERAIQLLVVLAQAIQENQVQQIDDNQLKDILMQMAPEKKDFKIKHI